MLEQFKINGQPVPKEEFTTDNFTIRWNKFSSSGTGEGGDGWHMDGVLVLKTGRMQVKKTFAGDKQAVEEAKKNFQIQVTSQSPGVTVQDGMILTTDGRNGTTPPSAYDASADEYTWMVPTDSMFRYTVTESGYEVGTEYEVNRQYMVKNSKNPDENTKSQWKSFPVTSNSVTVTARNSNSKDNIYLDVEFKNTYVKPGTLTLSKLDGISKNPMSGIQFQINYQDETGNATDLGVKTTDLRGLILLTDARPGTYTFEELNVPRGYTDPGLITLKVEQGGTGLKITSAESVNKNENENLQYVRFAENSMEFNVLNYSSVFVPVVVNKQWGENTRKQDVTMELRMGSQYMGKAYEAVLNGRTDNWSHTWDNMPVIVSLPVIVDQAPAVYTVRETKIGNMSYSTEYEGGYRYYSVDLEPMQYVMQDDTISEQLPDDLKQIKKIQLSVTNTQRTGQPVIRKNDSNGYPLAGASFQLYEIPDQDLTGRAVGDIYYVPSVAVAAGQSGNALLSAGGEPVKPVGEAAVSDRQGFVRFSSQLPAGRYYLIESQVPDGYENNTELYLLDFDTVQTHLYRYTEGGWVLIGDKTVQNTPTYVKLIVTNQVTGNMADRDMPFAFQLRSDRPILKTKGGENTANTNYILYLKHGESTADQYTLQLQSGSKVTLGQDNGYDYTASYTVTKTNSETHEVTTVTGVSFTMLDEVIRDLPADSTIQVDIVNSLDISPDTGVGLDGLPYILMLILAAAGLTGWFLAGRRRRRI